jgi:hypothetical protein
VIEPQNIALKKYGSLPLNFDKILEKRSLDEGGSSFGAAVPPLVSKSSFTEHQIR